MDGKPFVSVVMAVYNGQWHLREAVDSILNQTFTDFELIIVDDGSTDRTAQILADYATQDTRIVLLHHDTNLGSHLARNKAIAKARGKYIAIQDADDLSAPRRLSKQVAYLEKHPHIGVLGTWFQAIDDHGKPLHVMYHVTTPVLIRWTLLFDCALVHSSVLMRRSLLQKVGGYAPDKLYAHDYDLWCRMSRESDLVNLSEILGFYRCSSHSVSVKYPDIQREIARQIMQDTMSRLLGEKLSKQDSIAINKARGGAPLKSGQSIWRVAELLQKLYQTFVNSESLSEAEHQQIRADVVQKMFLLARMNILVSFGTSLRVFYLALRLRTSS